MKYTIILAFLFLFSFNSRAFSEEIEANVFADLQQIDQNIRYNVSSLASDLEQYINNTRFTDLEWEGPKIPVEISIALSGGSRDSYSARIIIMSKKYIDGTDNESSIALRFLDQTWSFKYSRGASHSYNKMRYDNFRTLIDFYMLLIIAYDADLYGELEGDKIYGQAKQILSLGTNAGAAGFEGYSKPGDFTKFNLLAEFTDPRNDDLRKFFFAYYYDGLDLMSSKKEDALENIANMIRDMADFKRHKLVGPSVLLQLFFDTKSEEIANILRDYKDKSIYKTLKYLDPTNTLIYDQARDNK